STGRRRKTYPWVLRLIGPGRFRQGPGRNQDFIIPEKPGRKVGVMQMRLEKQQVYNRWINILAIAIPLVVAVLLGVRQKIYLGEWTKVLPHINGMINSVTDLLLIAGRYYISKGNINMHRKAMTAAFILGSVFLVSYVLYHMSNDSTRFGAEEPLIRGI